MIKDQGVAIMCTTIIMEIVALPPHQKLISYEQGSGSFHSDGHNMILAQPKEHIVSKR